MKTFSGTTHTQKRGFTILETLVAITILMIAIVGPLTIAHRGLLDAVYASQQVTATYLAQDAIEYVKNIRDNNLIKIEAGVAGYDTSTAWLTTLELCSETTPCKLDTVNGDPYTPGASVSPCEVETSCFLYLPASGIGYTHDTTARKTPYSRYFYLTRPSGSTSYQAKMIVVVSWSTGTINNVFTFENEIFRITK